MTKFITTFVGCKVGASGRQYEITDIFECEKEDLFRLLYDKYEHIRLLEIYLDGEPLPEAAIESVYQSTNWSKETVNE